MGLDERLANLAILTFKPDPALARFWVIPPQPECQPFFFLLMLKLMGEWDSCFVWRHMGSWPAKANRQRPNDMVEFQILSGLDLPMGTADIVQYKKSEIFRLVTLLFSTTAFGWSVGQDVYVVPDNAQFIMKASHHDEVHVSFRDDKSLRQFVKSMKKEK